MRLVGFLVLIKLIKLIKYYYNNY